MFSLDEMTYFIPSQRLDVIAARQHYGLSLAQAKVFSKLYGLQQIPIANDLQLFDLALIPAIELLNKTQVAKEQIKVLIHTHSSKNIVPMGRSIARELQQHLGLSQANAFGMTLHNCATTLSAFEAAASLLTSYSLDAKALVVIAEKVFTANNKMIPNTSICGDAAATVLVSRGGEQHRLCHRYMHVDGRFSKGIWLRSQEQALFEQIYVETLATTILKTVSQAGLALTDLKLIVPHNVNLISWQRVINQLRLPATHVFLNNVTKYAHCFGADIIINTVDAINQGLLQKGDYYLMATVGLGATFGAAIFQY